jgi:sugar-specific transcriptional regulator TrmB
MTLIPLPEKLIRDLMLFGLTRNEAKVYVALLQLKKASARAVAKLANIPRQEVYRVLPRLEKLGMIEVIIDKPNKFLAIDPGEVLSELVEHQQEMLSRQISKLHEKKAMIENELKKVEGKSAGLTSPEPIRFALISGQRLINEKIQEMLRNAESEVLWIAPSVEILRAVIYDRDRILRKCAQRKVKVRIVTEVDKKNVKEIEKLSKFCEVRHSTGVTSLATIVDDKEIIIGSAVRPSGDLASGELMHELWTNDSGQVDVMKDFFEKVWNISIPAKLEIDSLKSGALVETIAVVQGQENIRKKLFDVLAGARSKLFIVSDLDDASISLIMPQLEFLQKRKVLIRWMAVVGEQNVEIAQKLTAKIGLHFLKERPISFVLSDSECVFSSTSVLQVPHEVMWSIDQNTVNVFWALAEEIWNVLSKDMTEYS